jgi:hypothetical protein
MVFESDITFNVRPASRSAMSYSGVRPRNPNRRSIAFSGDRVPVDKHAPSLVISVPSLKVDDQPAENITCTLGRRAPLTSAFSPPTGPVGRPLLHPAVSGGGHPP